MKVYTLRQEALNGTVRIHGVTASILEATEWIDEGAGKTIEEFDVEPDPAPSKINFVCDDDNWQALLNRFSRQLAEFQYTASLVVLRAREGGQK